jgi:hypothetical protein
MQIHLPIPTRLPGFETTITQTMDVSRLTDGQFTRVRNAARAGYVTGNGYVMKMLDQIAGRYGLMKPILVVRNGWHLVDVTHALLHPDNEHFNQSIPEELMALSDVRQKFADATKGAQHNKKSQLAQYDGTLGYLALVGWVETSMTELRKEILKRFEAVPEFVTNNKALAELVETRPVIPVYNKILSSGDIVSADA